MSRGITLLLRSKVLSAVQVWAIHRQYTKTDHELEKIVVIHYQECVHRLQLEISARQPHLFPRFGHRQGVMLSAFYLENLKMDKRDFDSPLFSHLVYSILGRYLPRASDNFSKRSTQTSPIVSWSWSKIDKAVDNVPEKGTTSRQDRRGLSKNLLEPKTDSKLFLTEKAAEKLVHCV